MFYSLDEELAISNSEKADARLHTHFLTRGFSPVIYASFGA